MSCLAMDANTSAPIPCFTQGLMLTVGGIGYLPGDDFTWFFANVLPSEPELLPVPDIL